MLVTFEKVLAMAKVGLTLCNKGFEQASKDKDALGALQFSKRTHECVRLFSSFLVRVDYAL